VFNDMTLKFSSCFLILIATIGLTACDGGSNEPATESASLPAANVSSLSDEMIAVGEAVGAGEYAFETVDYLSHNFGSLDDGKGNKYMVLAGSEAAHETADWIQGEMERIGLQDVTKEAYPIHAYELNGSSLTLVDSGEVIPTTAMAQTPPTPEGGITAEIVDVGFGLRSDYAGKDVEGKIILLSFNWEHQFYFNATMFEAKTRGVAGIIYDFLGQQNIADSLFSYPLSPFDDQAIPALNISHNSIASLREKLAAGSMTVTMELDAVDAFEGTDHNVLGYIRGSKYPDELIIIGDHFDHYFYGSLDCGTCVGSVLGLAKAFVDSGYEPDRTLVFIAHGAEENGWHTAWGPYINGAWNLIANAHPDWAGKTVAFFGWDWNGDLNSKSVSVDTYTNEVYTFIDSLRSPIDEFFTSHEPWSDYYRPASGPGRGGLSHQGWDALAYSNRGVPVFGLRSGDQDPRMPGSYHTQFDDISQTSGESLALGMVATAIAAIKLDRTDITPYDFSTWADKLAAQLTEDGAGLEAQGVDISENLDAIRSMGQGAKQLYDIIAAASDTSPATSAAVNALQRQAAIQVIPRMYFSAGDFPYSSQWRHSQYLRDSTALSETLSALDSGDTAAALESLLKVTSAYYGTNVSYEVHKAWIDFEATVLFSDSTHGPRIPKYTDVWHEAESLKEKIAAGSSDYADEIASLTATHEIVASRLRTTYDDMVAALLSATAPLAEASSMLQ
jgi:flavodoxin